MNNRLFPFLLISIVQLVAIGLGFEEIRFYTKPLLMPSLLFYFWRETEKVGHPIGNLVFTALIASFFGDTFLLFADAPEGGQNWFLAGLGSFLFAQLSYVAGFQKLYTGLRAENPSEKPFNFKAVLLPAVFFALMMSLIWSGLPSFLKVPVVVYGLAIAAMVATAGRLQGDIPERAFMLIFVGAVLFMCSDSLIALNRFTEKLSGVWKPSFWVMVTYLLGQAGIVLGLVKVLKK